jgi:hypothetical protein
VNLIQPKLTNTVPIDIVNRDFLGFVRFGITSNPSHQDLTLGLNLDFIARPISKGRNRTAFAFPFPAFERILEMQLTTI